MITSFLTNPFLNSRISDLKYKKFTEMHLKRLESANHDNRFDHLLSATQRLFSDFTQSIGQEATEAANRKGKTKSVDLIISEIQKFIARKEGVIADKVDKGSATYLAFFPLGLTEYSNVTKTNAETLFQRFLSATQANEAITGNELAAQTQALFNRYMAARDTQVKGIGNVKTIASESENKRTLLARQLYVNLLTLCLLFHPTPEQVKDYYDESFLPKAKTKAPVPPAA